MSNEYILVKQSGPLQGEVDLCGAKNAVLVVMASLLLTRGKSFLSNVPASSDVFQMNALLRDLGATVFFDLVSGILEIDTTNVSRCEIKSERMNKMRASILVMGPLLAFFGRAKVALPGGCLIGARPIDLHLKGFKKFGFEIEAEGDFLHASMVSKSYAKRIALEYPSIGATENLMMFAAMQETETVIINASLEPEVLDLVAVLKKMGAEISIGPAATIHIRGNSTLHPIKHEVVVDRLEAGALLIGAALTGGEIDLPSAQPYSMDLFLDKLSEMGHTVKVGENGKGVYLKATKFPRAVSFKTGPYPGFPTDLQAPFMAAQCVAEGKSVIEETVFENRFMHVSQLQKMGAQINVHDMKATVLGVEELYGTEVIASDIRASCALVLAGFVAENTTKVIGLHHWKRAYDRLEEKLILLGGKIKVVGDIGVGVGTETKLQKENPAAVNI